MKVFEEGAANASPGGLWAFDMREGGSDKPVRLTQTQIQIQIQTQIQTQTQIQVKIQIKTQIYAGKINAGGKVLLSNAL